MSQTDTHSKCEECGASIYQEHLDTGIARYENGRLLCSHCVVEYEKAHDGTAGGESTDDLAPIELEGFDEGEGTKIEMSSTRIHGVTEATLGRGSAREASSFKRTLQPDSTTANRCRVFHCRLSDGAIDFMNNQINDWLDENEDITIKFANSTIGLFEGKHTEPNMILTVFY